MIINARRLARFGAGLALALTAGGLTAITVTAASPPTSAYADSTVGGAISRTEMMARAQYWVDQNVVYGTVFDDNDNVVSTQSYPDQQGRNYRTDCSGLVSEAWHLSYSPTTDNFQDTASNPWHNITLDEMRPGDALVRNGHIELFARWASGSDHSQGAYVYSLNGPAFSDWAKGPTANSHGQVGFDGWSSNDPLTSYQPIPYNNVIEDASASASSKPDLLLANGTIAVYATHGDGTVWGASQSTPGGSFNAFAQLPSPGATLVGSPQALQLSSGIIAVFARTSTGAVMGTNQNAVGGSFYPWASLGGNVAGDPTVLQLSNGAMTMYASGTNGQVFGLSQQGPGGAWGSWTLL